MNRFRNPEIVSGSYRSCNERSSQKLVTAFSLIELMISLIVVSCITAAFTPVITKKLKSGSLIAGSVGDAFRNTKMGEDECETQTGIKNCSWCDTKKKECKICKLSKVCKEDEYENTPDCSCHKCISKFDSCIFCTSKECNTCIAGKYIDKGECKSVSDKEGCEGSKCYTDPNANPPVTEPKPCPDGSICPNGIKTDCTTAELTHKLCKDGVATTCPDGSICNNGIETKCTASNLTNTLCKNGVSQTCPEGSTCTNGIPTACTGKPANIWCVNGKTQTCPEGNTCSNGIHTSCNGKPANTWCINGTTQNCPEGSTCSNGKHKLCTGEPSTVRCLNGTKTNCTAGYYCVNGVQPSNKCKTDCENCSGASTCIGCKSNQYLSGGNCTSCPANASCNGSSFSCTNGFWSTGSGCQPCHSYCSTCTGAGSSACTSCKSSYWRSGTTCYTCPTHATCNGTSKTCHSNWSGSSCSTYTPPCTYGWYDNNGYRWSSKPSWSCSGSAYTGSCYVWWNTCSYCQGGTWCVTGPNSSTCGSCGMSEGYSCCNDGSYCQNYCRYGGVCTGTYTTWACK